mgnify:CR=1 FL=1
MCKIASYINKYGVEAKYLKSMADAIIHRGPDDWSIYISENQQIGLTHRRLSIIDLSSLGKQPMANEEGSVWLTFNGEIYNFKKLRECLLL